MARADFWTTISHSFKENHPVKLSLLCMGMGLASGAWANGEDTAKVYILKEVVVTATRSEQLATDVARSVSVIHREEIHRSIYLSPAEILSQQEGVYIVGTGQTPGSLQNIFLRGANGNHTSIFVDGVRITDPSTVDNAIDFSELSLANTEKIEIVRGSHSTLYGSAAIGGTVHVFTRKPAGEGATVEADIVGGAFGDGTSTLSEQVYANYLLLPGVYIQGEIFNQNVRGLDATVPAEGSPESIVPRDNDNFDNRLISGKVGYHDSELDVYASYTNTKQNREIDNGAFSDDDNYTVDFTRDLFTYGAGYWFAPNFQAKYAGGHTKITRHLIDDSSRVDNVGNYDGTSSEADNRGTVRSHEFQGLYRMPGFDIVVGTAQYTESMKTRADFYSRPFMFSSTTTLDTLDDATTSSLFGHADVNGSIIAEDLKNIGIGFGVRWNHHSTFGSHTTFELSGLLRIGDEGMLYGSFSTGFNAPSLYQLYSPDREFTSGITRGNRGLRPEKSRSYEVGLKQSIGRGTTFSLAYYATIVDNYIDFVYLWAPKDVDSLGFADYRGDTYLNTGKQVNTGFEIRVQSKISDELSVAANVSVVGGSLEYDPAELNTTHSNRNLVQVFANGAFLNSPHEVIGLTRRPNTVNATLFYTPIERITLRADGRFVGARTDIAYVPDQGPYGSLGSVDVREYTLMDISAKYTISEFLSATVRVENVFDIRYSEIRGYRTRGRGIFGSLRFAM
jgi:vitamin B12 transporter